jgi:hypothetical protein
MSGELKAMSILETTLKSLSDEELSRVMQWANARFRYTKSVGGKAQSANDTKVENDDEYPDLATFFSAAAPKTDGEKALVGAYWLQYREDATDVEAVTVNTRLKHLGYGIGNVTRAFESLKAEKPALIVQTKKEGSTQQARKKFKVTSEGKKRVEAMLAKTTEAGG